VAHSSLPTSAKELSTSTAPWLGISGLLIVLAGLHVVVDTSACIVTPLWPKLERHLLMADGSVLWLIVLWNMTTSFSQFFFGWFADQYRARWLIWAGPCVAVICMSSIGLAQNTATAAILLALGGLGIAAFHPEAAATAGATSPENRSRAMSVFAIGGYLGQALGPATGGGLVEAFGFPGLILVMALVFLVLPAISLRSFRQSFDAIASKSPSEPLRVALRGRSWGISLVLIIQTLRVITTMGIPLSLTFLLDQLGRSTGQIGFVSSMFMVGIGLGGVACALTVQRRYERRMLFVLPILVVAPLMLIPMWLDSIPATSALVLVCGVCLGLVLPIMIGYGQQLIPSAQRLASSLTMGVSWGIGGTLLAGYLYLLKSSNTVASAFFAFALASVLSSLASLALPQLVTPSDDRPV